MSTIRHAVFSRSTSKIDLTFDNKVVITFPAAKLGFLKGQAQHLIDEIIIQEKGTRLHWPLLDKSINLPEVITILIGD